MISAGDLSRFANNLLRKMTMQTPDDLSSESQNFQEKLRKHPYVGGFVEVVPGGTERPMFLRIECLAKYRTVAEARDIKTNSKWYLQKWNNGTWEVPGLGLVAGFLHDFELRIRLLGDFDG